MNMHTLLDASLWNNRFGLKISLSEKMFRPLIVYRFLFGMRLAGLATRLKTGDVFGLRDRQQIAEFRSV